MCFVHVQGRSAFVREEAARRWGAADGQRDLAAIAEQVDRRTKEKIEEEKQSPPETDEEICKHPLEIETLTQKQTPTTAKEVAEADCTYKVRVDGEKQTVDEADVKEYEAYFKNLFLDKYHIKSYYLQKDNDSDGVVERTDLCSAKSRDYTSLVIDGSITTAMAAFMNIYSMHVFSVEAYDPKNQRVLAECRLKTAAGAADTGATDEIVGAAGDAVVE